jgi:hypothetical protein
MVDVNEISQLLEDSYIDKGEKIKKKNSFTLNNLIKGNAPIQTQNQTKKLLTSLDSNSSIVVGGNIIMANDTGFQKV